MSIRRLIQLMVLLSLLLAAVSGYVVLAWSEAIQEGTCSLETIRGTYIFEARGAVIDGDSTLSYAEAGTWTLDGEGNAVGVLSASIDGEPFARREAFVATYAHVADCVYTAEDAFDLQFDLYTTPSGTTIMYFSPGFSGTMTRQ